MEIEIEFYVAPSGNCPFNDWMDDVKDTKTKTKILSRLDRLRLGNFGDCKSVGDGVSKLRIDYEPIPVKSFSRFSGSFEPIFDPNSGVNIRSLILTPEFGSKSGQNNPENRRKILLG